MANYDLIVIGGGIHGAGVLQAAAARGFRACLFERQHPAAGTSSRSSKLIHGGLRYLETAQIRLVRESLRERELLLKLAPDLVRLVPFLIPVYQSTRRRPWQIRAGLALYRVLSGMRPSGRFGTLPAATWGSLAGRKQDGLQGVFRYFDAQTDDAALTAAVLASACRLDAEACYPAEFIGAERDGSAYTVRIKRGGREEEHRCTVLVNAGGPWVNAVQNRIVPRPPITDVQLVQGTHIEFDTPLSESIFYVEAPQDRRAVFVIPWKGGTMVGTTESPYSGAPEDVAPLGQEIAYLQETLQAYFPGYAGRLRGCWAGLRVLPAGRQSPFSRSRETQLTVDDAEEPHLIAIYGGKLTAYRATAERVLDLAQPSLPLVTPLAQTDALPLT